MAFDTTAATNGPATGCCFILVTPDGERTMNTYLGAAQDLRPHDIDEALIAASAITYLEGYLWDPEKRQGSLRQGRDDRAWRKRQVALTLSDSFCVGRYRAEFLDLMRKGTVDLSSLTRPSCFRCTRPPISMPRCAVAQRRRLGVVTRSEKGCVVVSSRRRVAVPAFPIDKLVDTTGAGDLFAAGFLFGLVRNAGYENAATSARWPPPK